MNSTVTTYQLNSATLDTLFTRVLYSIGAFLFCVLFMFIDRRNAYHYAIIIVFCFITLRAQLQNINVFYAELDRAYYVT